MSFTQISDLVLANNHQFIAFNKPATLPAQADRTGDNSLLELGSAYCKTQLLPVHRIDRPTSGLIVFAKTQAAAAKLSEQFRARRNQKYYLAVVGVRPEKDEAELQHYLRKDGRLNRSHASKDKKGDAKLAKLHYRYLTSSERYHLLEIQLLTGRHHQIRAQLGAIGSPIRGDEKYGFKRTNPDRSIDLHAHRLQLIHPGSGEEVSLVAPIPQTPVWGGFDL